MSRTLVM